jgi:hypothetical protein
MDDGVGTALDVEGVVSGSGSRVREGSAVLDGQDERAAFAGG